MSKKKVLLIGQIPKEYGGSYTTGVANVIVNLLPYFSNDEYEIILWASNYKHAKNVKIHNVNIYGYSYQKILSSLFKYLLNKPHRLFGILKYRKYGISPLKNLLYESNLSRLLEEFQPDLFHVHNIKFFPATYYANNKNNNNIVLTFHGIQNNDRYSIEQNRKLGIDLPKLFKLVSAKLKWCSVLTDSMLNEAHNSLNIPKEYIYKISNGVSNIFNFNNKERFHLRNEFGLTNDDILFLSVGAHTKRKNYIEAINYLRLKYDNFKYIIIGRTGDYEREIREITENDERIMIVPYVDNKELYKYYSAADFLMLPSTNEGQALVGLEALSCGLPLLVNLKIIGTLGINEKYFKHYYQTIDFEQSSNIKLDTIKKEERTELAQLAQTYLNWKSSARKYLNLYEEIIKNI
jgi:glycosyltransferase involved in cell wall biosynthesis